MVVVVVGCSFVASSVSFPWLLGGRFLQGKARTAALGVEMGVVTARFTSER